MAVSATLESIHSSPAEVRTLWRTSICFLDQVHLHSRQRRVLCQLCDNVGVYRHRCGVDAVPRAAHVRCEAHVRQIGRRTHIGPKSESRKVRSYSCISKTLKRKVLSFCFDTSWGSYIEDKSVDVCFSRCCGISNSAPSTRGCCASSLWRWPTAWSVLLSLRLVWAFLGFCFLSGHCCPTCRGVGKQDISTEKKATLVHFYLLQVCSTWSWNTWSTDTTFTSRTDHRKSTRTSTRVLSTLWWLRWYCSSAQSVSSTYYEQVISASFLTNRNSVILGGRPLCVPSVLDGNHLLMLFTFVSHSFSVLWAPTTSSAVVLVVAFVSWNEDQLECCALFLDLGGDSSDIVPGTHQVSQFKFAGYQPR